MAKSTSPTAKIEFHLLVDPFDFNARKIKEWINKIISQYNKKAGVISIIFCSDEYLLELNKKFLQHDYYTDIITFPMESLKISGELYISLDRVQENAKKLKIDFELEFLRVIIHGILHLLGFNDKTKKEEKEMREKENAALSFYKSNFLKEEHYFDQVYDVVRMIPKGRVSTYGAIADFLALGSARMTGWALNQLKGDVMDVPAHRVVNRIGELSGRLMFGDGGQRMEKLLKAEGVIVEANKVKNFNVFFWHPESLNKNK